jgi:mannose-6-phosphate isomerase-like protein (cupin superfamily)
MHVCYLDAVAGEHFPSGRWTRLLAGATSDIQPDQFVVGYSVVRPGGGIPAHQHVNEEVYVLLSGTADMVVGNEQAILSSMVAIYIPPNMTHQLTNVGDDDLHLLFIYAPPGIMEHWQAERNGQLAMRHERGMLR